MRLRGMAFPFGRVATLAGVACGPPSLGTATGYNDTWTWDGQTWTDRSTQDRPPARRAGLFAFDAARGVAILFGGEDFEGKMLDDTWTWDGRNSTMRSPKRPPSARAGPLVAHHSAPHVLSLFARFLAP